MGGFVINGKRRIRSLANNLPESLKGKSIVLAVDLSSNLAKAQRIGFSEKPAVGDTLLPKIIGPATRLNSYGRDIIRRDKEKETLYREQAWTHEEWAGRGETRTVTTYVMVPYKRFPRDHIDGFGVELSIRESNGKLIIATLEPITYSDKDAALLTAAINVYLEAFGYVELFDQNFSPVPRPLTVRRLNWDVLPKGEKITKEKLKDVLSKSKRIRPVEWNRQEKISSYGPAEIAIGTAGFAGYIIYVFPGKKLAVLESLKYGNASYVLDDGNWEDLSKLTKQQLLSAKLVKSREVHYGAWGTRIDRMLR
jgi:hypothetical protein